MNWNCSLLSDCCFPRDSTEQPHGHQDVEQSDQMDVAQNLRASMKQSEFLARDFEHRLQRNKRSWMLQDGVMASRGCYT